MSDSMHFIDALNEALGELFSGKADSFTFDDNALLAISFEGHADVMLQASEESRKVMASSEVIRMTTQDPAVWKKALELNFFELAPLGAFLAYDEVQSSLLLCHVAGAELTDPELLGDFLADMVAGVEQTRELLNAGGAGRSHDEPPMSHEGVLRA